MIIRRDILMLYLSYDGRICDFLPKCYFVTWNLRYMAEMHLSEKSQVSGKMTFKFAVKNSISTDFMGDSVLPSHKSDTSLFMY